MLAFVFASLSECTEAVRIICRQAYLLRFLLVLLIAGSNGIGQISNSAYQLINSRTAANQSTFFVYQDTDSGFNHGFPSGYFGLTQSISVDSACVFDSTSLNGCSSNSAILDEQRGTAIRVSFAPLTNGEFAGLNFEEPENWGVDQVGQGYDLTGSTSVSFDIFSPTPGMNVQIGVAGFTSPYFTVPQAWTTMTFPLNMLGLTASDLTNVHILFAIATNVDNLPSRGGTVLLDNIQFTPAPTRHQSALSLPISSQVFGIKHVSNALPAPFTIPPDQNEANLATVYESSLVELALLSRGTAQDLQNAKLIADAFVYALANDNQGDPVPVAPDNSTGLHNAYSTGDVALFNSQSSGAQMGQVRLAGFSAATLCPQTGFCLVLDGAAGGNNAFAILALLNAFQKLGDQRYLTAALTIGNWIYTNLADNSGTGFGGYFVGHDDMGVPPPKPLNHGKSVENNADIFSAFSFLASIEKSLGNPAQAMEWSRRANLAGDFVMSMFDSAVGRFNAGTVPQGTGSSFGITPNGQVMGNDIINTFDFLDANTFTTLALAPTARYFGQIDWHRPIQYALSHFGQSVTAGGQQFSGFNLINPGASPTPNGIAWEFTSQVVQTLRIVDSLYGQSQFEETANTYFAQIVQAQIAAPFADQLGLVASTLQDGDLAHTPPYQECLVTPFQCIAERVGVAATTWAIFANQKVSPFFTTPGATLSSTAVAFGSQTAGTASAEQAITLSNSGILSLSFSSISLTGASASQFSLVTTATSCPYSGGTLAAGGSCTMDLVFVPQATATFSASVQVQYGGQGGSQTIPLSGIGAGPATSYSISGRIRIGGVGMAGVALSLSTGQNTVSDGDGNYSFTGLAGGFTFTVIPSLSPYRFLPASSAFPNMNASQTADFNISGPLVFISLTPCRVLDTRRESGAFGGPEMAAGSMREFDIPNSGCGVPPNASAYSLNVTVVPDGVLGFLSIWPSGQPQPLVSTLNSDGRVKANGAIVPAGINGGVDVYVSNSSHVILDINGYFVAGNNTALAFYPLTPCRIADTRSATSPLGGPYLTGGAARTFPILASACNIPPLAQAYSLNFTAIPHGPLGFLATWPTGEAQSPVSTLNSSTGTVTANAAIVSAGTNGSVNVYGSNDSDVVIDVNGYFGPPGPGGLSLYNVTPCRALDTRTGNGAPFLGIINLNVSISSCNVPATSDALVVNATVVPSVSPFGLRYLSLWPSGSARPLVSTLNASDGAVTSNMAIVPANNGSISIYSTDPTHLILDISGYFAP